MGRSKRGVILEIHSEIDRPILGFSVKAWRARMLLQMVEVQQPVVVSQWGYGRGYLDIKYYSYTV